MFVCIGNTIVLTEEERAELNQRAASRSGRADDARRARLILLLEAAPVHDGLVVVARCAHAHGGAWTASEVQAAEEDCEVVHSAVAARETGCLQKQGGIPC
jgi:hypothetical protein